MNQQKERDGWKYRRLVVFALTVQGLALPFFPQVNPDVYWPVYTLVTGAVSAYIGFSAWEDRGRYSGAPRRATSTGSAKAYGDDEGRYFDYDRAG